MNKNRVIFGLVVAIAVAVLLSVFVYREFQQASAVRPVRSQQIVVAAGPLALGTRLDANNITMIPWPAGSPLPGMLTSTDSAVGRAVITPVVANEPILESKLAPREA